MGTIQARPHSHRPFAMNMKHPFAPILAGTLLCAILASPLATAAEPGGGAVRNGGLELSLTREDMGEAWGAMPMANATTNTPTHGLPDFGGGPVGPSGEKANPRRGGARQGDLPYGAGYEARQQGSNGGGAGGGRSMGRRR